MAAAVPYAIIGGALMSGMNAIQQGSAARAGAEYNARIARENAEIAREQTVQAVRQADREAYLRLGAIRAAAGASGGKQDGSVLDVLADTAAQNEIHRQDIIRRGELAERGHRNTAQLEEFSGANAERSGYLAAGAELLQGAGSAYSARARMTRA